MLSATSKPEDHSWDEQEEGAGAAPKAAAQASSLAGRPLPTPLSGALGTPASDLRAFCGALTPQSFAGVTGELNALFSSTVVADLGFRAKVLIRGEDRMRWLSGMVTNTVQGLQENEGNYSFVLNNQGRIQGDCQIYRRANELVLDTARSRVAELLAHLNHYIIMDEVELVDVSDDWTALQLIGPKARHILETAAIPVLAAAGPPDANFHLSTVHIGEAEAVLVQSLSILLPRYELWMRPQDAGAIWRRLLNAGAEAAGVNAIEALRIAEGTPLFGVDFGEKDLPQETGQTRALNFTKGCYLGQEIVERIRSRGKVHRKLHQFALDGEVPRTPFELRSQGQPVGQISSAASISTSQLTGSFGLGFVRDELFDSGAAIEYDGGRATILERPPRMPAS